MYENTNEMFLEKYKRINYTYFIVIINSQQNMCNFFNLFWDKYYIWKNNIHLMSAPEGNS